VDCWLLNDELCGWFCVSIAMAKAEEEEENWKESFVAIERGPIATVDGKPAVKSESDPEKELETDFAGTAEADIGRKWGRQGKKGNYYVRFMTMEGSKGETRPDQ
jgi:hypothetical protein